MRRAIKQKRLEDKLAAFLTQHGVAPEVVESAKVAFKEVKQTTNTPEQEANSVLMSLKNPMQFETRKCQNSHCSKMFATNYRYVTHCSDACTARSLEEHGLKWDSSKSPRERWGSELFPKEPPQIISPEAYQAMLTTAKNLVQVLGTVQIGKVQSELESPSSEIQELQVQIESLVKDHPTETLPPKPQTQETPAAPEFDLPSFDL